MPNLQNLFSEAKIGGLTLKNRIVMPPMLTGFAEAGGTVSPRMLDYYRERAEGGAGLVIVESTNIEVPDGEHYLRQLSLGDDRFIEGLRRLSSVIREGGARAGIQIGHQGRFSAPFITGTKTLSPSPEPPLDYWPESPEMGEQEIGEVIRTFAQAAKRAREAGFDAVELHGAHGYLICQFLSPLTNRREDRYGGGVKQRASFLIEVIEAVRRKVGSDFPLSLRLSADEYADGGITPQDTAITAKMAEKAGVDCLHVSAGSYYSKEPVSIAPMALPRGCLVHLASRIKNVVNVPVITVGRINDPVLANSIIVEGKADLVAMGRALLADPELPRKAEAEAFEQIRYCIACNTCIDLAVMLAQPLICAVNARAGRERELEIKKSPRPRSVYVLGGGPAGMEAARVAALRGHDVTLFERKPELGGQLLLASKPPFKEEISSLARYLTTQIDELGVSVRLASDFTEELLSTSKSEGAPDGFIVATGCKPRIPEIPGIERELVATADDVLEGRFEPGDRVVVLGGETIGVEVAALLADQGKEVAITRRGKRLAEKMASSMRRIFLDFFREKNVKVLKGVEYLEISDEGLWVKDADGNAFLLEADSLVLAAGNISDNAVGETLKEKGYGVYAAGDCVEPRDIRSAIHEGFVAGLMA